MIEDSVDRALRTYRPPPWKVFRQVKRRCRREGWALNKLEESAVLSAAWEYTRSLRRRTRQIRILDGYR
jgi:hypothetical protein